MKIVLIICLVSVGVLVIVPQLKKTQEAWNELFASIPERTATYTITEHQSRYGAGISFPQRVDGYAQQYLNKQELTPDEFKDITELNGVLLDTMTRFPINMQSYIALGNLALASLTHLKNPPEVLIDELELAGQGISRITPNHPKGNYYIEQAKIYRERQP